MSVSAKPLAAEATNLIGKETNEHRTSNVQHRTSNEWILSICKVGRASVPAGPRPPRISEYGRHSGRPFYLHDEVSCGVSGFSQAASCRRHAGFHLPASQRQMKKINSLCVFCDSAVFALKIISWFFGYLAFGSLGRKAVLCSQFFLNQRRNHPVNITAEFRRLFDDR